MRHGLRAGMLPKGASYIKRDCDILRRLIEEAVIGNHGEVSLFNAAMIQTAIRWERHAMLTQRWLRKEIDSMSASERILYSKDIATASTNRDKCLKELGLNTKQLDVFDALYADDPADNATAPAEAPKVEPDKVVEEPSKTVEAKPERLSNAEFDADEDDEWDL